MGKKNGLCDQVASMNYVGTFQITILHIIHYLFLCLSKIVFDFIPCMSNHCST